MKRVLALALAMVMALSLAACGGSGDTSTGDSGSSGGNVVRIGVFEPATGDSGPGGKQEMLGMQYANKETPTVDIGVRIFLSLNTLPNSSYFTFAKGGYIIRISPIAKGIFVVPTSK